MTQTEWIVEAIKSMLDIFYEDEPVELVEPQVEIVLNWKHNSCKIGIKRNPLDGFSEQDFFIKTNQNKKDFIRRVINRLITLSTLNLRVAFEFYESGSNFHKLKTKKCETLEQRVSQFTDLPSRELFKVAFRHEGCDVELFLFINENIEATFDNVLTTGGYFNPVVTNELVVKLLDLSNNHPIFEKVGFVGSLSVDRFATVNSCIQMVHEKIVKLAERIKRRNIEARKVSNCEYKEDIEKLFDDLHVSKKKEPEESHRYSFRKKRLDLEFVDLTSDEDKTDHHLSDFDDTSDESFYSFACSEILETGPSLDDFCCKYGYPRGWNEYQKDVYKTSKSLNKKITKWFSKQDSSSKLYYQYENPLDEAKLNASQKEYEMEKITRDMEKARSYFDKHKISLDDIKPEVSQANRIIPVEELRAKTSRAESYYEQKSNRDYTEAFSPITNDSRCTEIAKTSDGKHPHKLNKQIDIKERPRLLDKEDYEKLQNTSFVHRSDGSEMRARSMAPSLSISKEQEKVKSPGRRTCESMENKAESNITKRRPIHKQELYTNSYFQADSDSLARIKKIMAKVDENVKKQNHDYDPKAEAVSLGRPYPFKSPCVKKYSTSASSSKEIQNDNVINLDDDDDEVEIIAEDENNDTNNNNSHRKRKLCSLPENNIISKNRIFTSKNGQQKRSKPDFSK